MLANRRSARPMTEISSFIALSFRSQRYDRIELGRAARRINSEKQTDRGGKRHADDDRVETEPPWEPA